MNPPEPDLKAIFSEALDRPEGPERTAYLDRACAGNPALRAGVETLLKAHAEAGAFLASTVEPATLDHEPTASLRPRGILEGPGTEIGPYKLLQQIGEGGMGVVFMAEQEKPVRRKVALKVIKPGMDTGQVVARFEAERQALAMMDHPNIARVLDVGATATGRPFFVMELVKGVPITEYSDRNQLTPKERLELFMPVCRAIQHAHQKGIIHRDIKPSNVLVTLHDGQPVPKVIDFGVAKAIDQRLTEKTMFTEFGAVIGTLEYMSPEQAEMGALDVDTRSDIYSLGVLLYELLTGSTPLERARLRQAAFSEVLRRIREEEPAKPSTRLSESKDALPSISAQRKMEPTRLTRLIRGDLDWIVMKSLEKDRTRRYETATGFARDVQRYLDGDAVEACPPSVGYRFRKFARKHRAGLATAGAFAVVLMMATAISLGLAVWANRERDRANRERDRAVLAEKQAEQQRRDIEATNKALEEQRKRAHEREQMAIDAVKRFGDVIAKEPELKNDPKLAPLRARLLKEPQAFYKKLRDLFLADRLTFSDSQWNLANWIYSLGLITTEIGDKQEALQVYRQALGLFEGLARANPSLGFFHDRLAQTQINIGLLLSELGRQTEALASYESARESLERLVRDDPSDPELKNTLAKSHTNIGIVLSALGRNAEALAAYQRVVVILEKLVRDNPSNIEFKEHLGLSHSNLGNIQEEVGRPVDAMASYERAREILEPLARENPSQTDVLSSLSMSYNNIGQLQQKNGQTAKAMISLDRALVIRERLTQENPSATDFSNYLATSHHAIGNLFFEMGQYAESLAALEKARAIREKLVRDNPSVIDFQVYLANVYRTIGFLTSKSGRNAEALAVYEQARTIREKLARDNPSKLAFQIDLAKMQDAVGQLLFAIGRNAEALASYQQARVIWERLIREEPSSHAIAAELGANSNNIALVDMAENRMDAARSKLILAIGWQRKALAASSDSRYLLYLSEHLKNLSIIVLGSRSLDSLNEFRTLLEQLTRDYPDSSDFACYLGACWNNLATIDLGAKKFDEARSKLIQAIEWQRKALAANHPNSRQFLMNHLNNLAEAADGLGHADEAAQARRELAELAASDPAKK